MAPHKKPTSLMSLSMKATVQLYHTALVHIDSIRPQDAAYKEAVDTVQSVFLETLPFRLWDLVFEEVRCFMLRLPVPNYSIMYSIFMHANLRNLTINPNHFTAENFLKVRNLVTLNLSPRAYDTHETILGMIGLCCTKLESIHFKCERIAEALKLLAGCVELRSITYIRIYNEEDALTAEHTAAMQALQLFPKLQYYSFCHMGHALSSLESSAPLNLLRVQERKCSVDHIVKIISLCPNLDHLDLSGCRKDLDWNQVFEILALSTLEISEFKVTITDFDVRVERFFEMKGNHLHKLSIACPPMPESTVQSIALNCKNLTHLTFDVSNDHTTHNNDPVPVKVSKSHESLLTKLVDVSFSSSTSTGMILLTTLLPRESNISSLEIVVPHTDVNKELIQLIDSTNMTSLARLNLMAAGSLSERVLRGFYEKCHSLSYMNLDCYMNPEALSYLMTVREDVKENNLDLVITGLFV